MQNASLFLSLYIHFFSLSSLSLTRILSVSLFRNLLTYTTMPLCVTFGSNNNLRYTHSRLYLGIFMAVRVCVCSIVRVRGEKKEKRTTTFCGT